MASPTAKDNWKQDHKQGSSTGKFSLSAQDLDDWAGSRKFLATEFMQSCQDPQPPTNTSGSKTQEWMEHSSSLAENLSNVTVNETGNPYWPPQSPEIWRVSTLPWSFVILVPCLESARNILNLLLSNDLFLSSGVAVDLANQDEPGMKPALMLILKIREANSGTAIVVKNMLLSMNLEEVSTLPIFYDGVTDIQSLWKSRDLLLF